MILVIIESPYAGDFETNIRYARAAMLDCLNRYEAPFASHLLYTQPGILDDTDIYQPKLGTTAGLQWGDLANKTVVYQDLGIASGMIYGIKRAIEAGRPVEYRRLEGWQ